MVALFLLLVVLQALDIYTTWKIVGKQNGREMNVFLAEAFKYFGVLPTLFGIKALFLILAYLFLLEQPEILIGLCVIYGYVVWQNFGEMK